MTGAQEQALARLAKKHKLDVVEGNKADPDVRASYRAESAWGGPKRVRLRITPEGRVIEQP